MSQLNSVWVFSDNPERYAELFGGAQQWGQQVYAIVQNTDQCIDSLEVRKKPGGHWIIRDLIGLDLVGLASL